MTKKEIYKKNHDNKMETSDEIISKFSFRTRKYHAVYKKHVPLYLEKEFENYETRVITLTKDEHIHLTGKKNPSCYVIEVFETSDEERKTKTLEQVRQWQKDNPDKVTRSYYKKMDETKKQKAYERSLRIIQVLNELLNEEEDVPDELKHYYEIGEKIAMMR